MDILTLLQHLNPLLAKTTLRQLSLIIYAMLAMTGRVTMLGISRWSDDGGSYRTIQRFFQTTIPWGQVFWSFFCNYLRQDETVYILAGDESVISKNGKQTYGLDRFYASLFRKAVPGVAIFALSLVTTQERRAYPIMVEQVVRSGEEKAVAPKKRRNTRPKPRPRKENRVAPKGAKTGIKRKFV